MKCLQSRVYPSEAHPPDEDQLQRSLVKQFQIVTISKDRQQERGETEVVVASETSVETFEEEQRKNNNNHIVEKESTTPNQPVTCWESNMPPPLTERREKELLLKGSADDEVTPFADDDSDFETDNLKAKLLSADHIEEEGMEMENLSSKEDLPTFHSSSLAVTDTETLLDEIELNELKPSGSSHSSTRSESRVFYRDTPPGTVADPTDELINTSDRRNDVIVNNSAERSSSAASVVQTTNFINSNLADSADKIAVYNTDKSSSENDILSRDNDILNEVDDDVIDEAVENDVLVSAEDGNEDASSEVSVFIGSLGLEMKEGIWLTDIERVVDIQLGEQEWGTTFYAIEATPADECWETTFLELEEDAETEEGWSTALHEISEGVEGEHEWTTMIAGNFENKEVPLDWATTFNAIEKADEIEDIWTTAFNRILLHLPTKEVWVSTFNAIRENIAPEEEWGFKITGSLSNLAEETDWSFRFNKIEDSNMADPWETKLTEMILQSDDRESHWDTKFLAIAETREDLEKWETTFRDLVKDEEEDPWTSKFNSISDELNCPEDWGTQFLEIEKHEPEENEWPTTIYEMNLYKEEEDWSTAFLAIENDKKNALWDTKFNAILPSDDPSEVWSSAFNTMDLQDEGWETSYNLILNEGDEVDWEVTVNPIINEGDVGND